MNSFNIEVEIYERLDDLHTLSKAIKDEIDALADQLPHQYYIQCLWTKDYKPHGGSHIEAGHKTFYSPYTGYTGQHRAFSQEFKNAKLFRSRRDAEFYLEWIQGQRPVVDERFGKVYSIEKMRKDD